MIFFKHSYKHVQKYLHNLCIITEKKCTISFGQKRRSQIFKRHLFIIIIFLKSKFDNKKVNQCFVHKRKKKINKNKLKF